LYLLAANPQHGSIFNANRQHTNRGRCAFPDIVEHSQGSDAQFPGCDRIWPERFSIPSFSQRFIRELVFDGFKNRCSLPDRQDLKVRFDGVCEHDLIGHARFPDLRSDVSIGTKDAMSMPDTERRSSETQGPTIPNASQSAGGSFIGVTSNMSQNLATVVFRHRAGQEDRVFEDIRPFESESVACIGIHVSENLRSRETGDKIGKCP
jgi:hypothetical protein